MGQDDAKVPTEMSDADEEAIRAKLREAGWDKNKILTKSKSSVAATGDEQEAAGKRTESDDKSHEKKRSGRDKDKEKDRSGRTEKRRSRSVRRRDKDRSDRRRDRERDRGARRRRSSRSRSVSKSRSRSASARRRGKEKDRSGKRRSRSLSAASRSRSPSRGGSKRSRRGDTKDVKKPSAGEDTANGENGKEKKANAPAESTATNGNAKPADEAQDETKKAGSDDRKSRKSSRHRSRSASRSPSRSRRRRRRHRSPSRSRSASRGHGGRGGRRGSSRSRSRSHSRRRRSSRRRSSRSRSRSRGRGHSRSRSRSYSRRRRRSSSRDRSRSRRDANSSPQPHQFPPTTDAASAAAVNPLNPSIAQLMQQYPTMSLQDIIAKMQASNVTMAAAVSMKPARELYVGNLPASVTGPQLQEFLGTIIQQVGLTVQPGNPILSTWISTDGHFAFCEMRSIEECNMALMLNQLPLLGQPLKFGRPKSFMGPPQPMPVLPPRTQTALSNLGCTPNTAWFATPATDVSSVAAMTASMSVAPSMAPLGMGAPIAPFSAPAPAPIPMVATLSEETSSNKLIMSNIPVVLTEDQVKELVEPFGELKSFALVNDPVTQQPTGSALFEYVDESVTEDAKNGLDGLDLGGIPLAVRRANASEETGPVLRLANMVSIDELKDDEEFADLKEDVEEECKRFGQVVALEIPRPNDGEMVAGLGDIFVQFETPNEAAAALKALSGRKFGGNIVKVSYFPLAKLQQKDFA